MIGSKFPCTTPVRHEFTRSPPSPSCTGQEIGSGHADLWYRHGSSRPATSAIPPRVEVDDWLLVQLVGADVKLTQTADFRCATLLVGRPAQRNDCGFFGLGQSKLAPWVKRWSAYCRRHVSDQKRQKSVITPRS